MKAPADFLDCLSMEGGAESWPWNALHPENPKPSLEEVALAQLGEKEGRKFLEDYARPEHISRRGTVLVDHLSGPVLTTSLREILAVVVDADKNEPSGIPPKSKLERIGLFFTARIQARDLWTFRALLNAVVDLKNGKVDSDGVPEIPPTRQQSQYDLRAFAAFGAFFFEHERLPTKHQLRTVAGLENEISAANDSMKRIGLRFLPDPKHAARARGVPLRRRQI